MSDFGLQALRANVIDLCEAAKCSELEKCLNPKNPGIILAMMHGLVSVTDFCYGGRYNFWARGARENIPDWELEVASFIELHKPEQISAATVIQSFWRGYKDRSRVGLYRELDRLMHLGDHTMLEKFTTIKQLLDEKNLVDAQSEIEGVRETIAKKAMKRS